MTDEGSIWQQILSSPVTSIPGRMGKRILPKNIRVNLEDMDIESNKPTGIMITMKGIPDGPSGL